MGTRRGTGILLIYTRRGGGDCITAVGETVIRRCLNAHADNPAVINMLNREPTPRAGLEGGGTPA